jgi:hypothetical protein
MIAFDLKVEIVLQAMLDLLWSQLLMTLSYDDSQRKEVVILAIFQTLKY